MVYKDEKLLNRFGRERINDRQIDELVGIARGLCADGALNQAEVEYLQKWLAVNAEISGQPIITTLFHRVNEALRDGVTDDDELADLLSGLRAFSAHEIELGEALKASTLPICEPPPVLNFNKTTFCFTGTFNFGPRRKCEAAVAERGGICGSLSQKTNVLVIGVYATESWKHSSFGNKIVYAVEMRDSGVPISIVSEEHWAKHI